MAYQLLLNGKLLTQGEPKECFQLFDSLSGLSFGRGPKQSWLNKMTAVDAYSNYLNIKGKELGVETWEGELMLIDQACKPVRVYLFETHGSLVQSCEEDNALVHKQN